MPDMRQNLLRSLDAGYTDIPPLCPLLYPVFHIPVSAWKISPSLWQWQKSVRLLCSPFPVEILSAKFQIRDHSRMDPLLIGIFFPYFKIWLHINPLDSVKGYHVKFTDRFICIPAGFLLSRSPIPPVLSGLPNVFPWKKLQHHRRSGSLIRSWSHPEKDPFSETCLFHLS